MTADSGILVNDRLVVRHLGRVDYAQTWQAMQDFTAQRNETTPDELWFLEHPPVFTQGQAGRAEHLLAPGDIPVVQVDRGGQVTYHGPGQLVCYVLLDLRRLGIGPRVLVERIEQAIVATLDDFGVSAYPRSDAHGVYVRGGNGDDGGERKIASLGLRIRRGCSYHGLALNVAMDLEPFRRINPCGHAGMAVTQLADERPGDAATPIDPATVVARLERHLRYTFRPQR